MSDMRSAAGRGDGVPERTGSRASAGAAVMQYELRGVRVVVMHGAYDQHSIPPLEEALAAAARDCSLVVLDASGVRFADSSLLNLMLRTRRVVALRLAAPPPQLQRLLEITGADAVLDTRATVEEAVGA
ncbi:STAS domain-containing protein [Streptomyces andamanensis]|uniref:STAS domain-containing protein n=3 Tax=Streptomyces TaxID=1883 RepID=A0ABV8T8S6_9ACTN|nr:anti-sigma factor antagonist [Streptomyces sp. Tu 6176]